MSPWIKPHGKAKSFGDWCGPICLWSVVSFPWGSLSGFVGATEDSAKSYVWPIFAVHLLATLRCM